ncbi:MAG TPA: hypothetical protein VN648_21260, partial [Candidatus Methylomirabilis sp.]|nr:hypothetical protein [Candidatus Methylomirabilis sp.]
DQRSNPATSTNSGVFMKEHLECSRNPVLEVAGSAGSLAITRCTKPPAARRLLHERGTVHELVAVPDDGEAVPVPLVTRYSAEGGLGLPGHRTEYLSFRCSKP